MQVFDTHAHLLSDAFDDDREQVIARIHAAGVCLCMEAGTTLEDSAKAAAQAEQYDFLYAAAGIHPHEAEDAPADALDRLTVLLRHPKCKALGEIGLDYHYDFSPRDVQKRLFAEQLDLAIQMDKDVYKRQGYAFAPPEHILKFRRAAQTHGLWIRVFLHDEKSRLARLLCSQYLAAFAKMCIRDSRIKILPMGRA